MSKLNKAVKPTSLNNTAISYNGNPQYPKDTEMQLYEVVTMTMYGKDEFYETSDIRLTRLRALVDNVVSKNNFDFIANTIIHARSVMNIRTMPIILTVEFIKSLRTHNKQYSNARKLVCDVIQRADQITDLMAYALTVFGDKKALPTSIKRGVADALNKFNEYSFGKYNRDGAVKFKDVLRIVHPTPTTTDQGSLYERIMKNEIAIPVTWETKLSDNGKKDIAERKTNKQLWTELIDEKALGYMALLRNLRNIAQSQVDDEVIEKVCERLSNPKEVEKSKQLPFRFVNALIALSQPGNISKTDCDRLNNAIRKAGNISLSNIPSIGNNVWIILDVSSSMGSFGYGSSLNASTSLTPIQTGSLFASALLGANKKSQNVKITIFSDRAQHLTLNPGANIFSNYEEIQKKVYGGGTELQAALDLKVTLGFEPDTVIVLSDMQVNQLHSKTEINKLFGPEVIKVAFNLNAYPSTPVCTSSGWFQMAGWSERAFDFVPAMRNKVSVVDYLSKPYMGLDKIKRHVDEHVED